MTLETTTVYIAKEDIKKLESGKGIWAYFYETKNPELRKNLLETKVDRQALYDHDTELGMVYIPPNYKFFVQEKIS